VPSACRTPPNCACWVTPPTNLVGKLPRDERQRLTYGAPRLEGTPGEAPLLFTFARLADIAAPGAAPPAVADLAVAELLDLHASLSHSPGGSR
jgi:hypothetical protein